VSVATTRDGDSLAALREVERAIMARAPEHDIVPSLDRVALLVDLLGHPERAMPVIHLTGTNGKTSTARMVEGLLRGFGLHTGRFTSPHLHSITERIALAGQPLAPARFVATYADVEPYLGLVDKRSDIPMSFFEVLVGMAFAAFAEAPVEVAVVEVGLGGSWDATNVADGQVAVITPIAIDHTRFLGLDVMSIATEKAGIIKAGAQAVLGRQSAAAAEVLARRIAAVGAGVVRQGVDFGVQHRALAVGGQVLTLAGLGGTYEDVFLPLHGAHQADNAVCALAAVEAFLGGGAGRLDLEVVRESFAAASSPGRLEVLRTSPTVIIDAAHNPAGARATAEAVAESFALGRVVGVVGSFADKDVRGILAAFEPVMDEIVITRSSSPRAMDPDALAAVAVDVFGPDRVEVAPRLDDAIDIAVGLAEDTEPGTDGPALSGGVLITGSISTAAEARILLGSR
jgi:dihydrofolate synthase/folylpolyglutamate synthase